MKRKIFSKPYHLILLISLWITSSAYPQDKIITNYTKADQIQSVLDQLVKGGIPGVALTIYSKEGWYQTSAGFSRLENKMPMTPDNLHYLQSVAKTYMATGILHLNEQGRIGLDDPMTKYLPQKYSQYISEADKITVRMLLNHTSGIPEYNAMPAYVTKLLQHNDYPFTPEDYLKYINKKPLSFRPGSKYSYRNTNYLILALIADALTGDHAKFLSGLIVKPLGLEKTFYRDDAGYLEYPNLNNGYWDRHSDGIIENASELQKNNVAALIGDDGIVASPKDAVSFLKGLMEGKFISASTLELMKVWEKDNKGNPTYGLGLDYTTINDLKAYGHSGGGLGAGCQLYYIPERNVYFFIGINLGTVTDSPLHENTGKLLEKLYSVILE